MLEVEGMEEQWTAEKEEYERVVEEEAEVEEGEEKEAA